MDAGARGIEVDRRLARQNLSASLRVSTQDVTGNRRPNSTDKGHKATESPELREASFEDYPRIAALQVEYGFPKKSFEEWKHLWINNPAYTQSQERLPIGWVLECGGKQIVGYLGNIPLFYEFEGRRLLASVAHAWVVDTCYRSYSLLLLDRYFSQKTVELFLNATVGPAASDSFAVFRSLPAPVGAWDRSAFWITNRQGFLAGWLAKKAFPLAKPLSYGLSVGLFVKQACSKRTLNRPLTGVELQGCTEIDDRFDIFWDALRKGNPRVLLGVRSREMLEWHFKYALGNSKAWIVTASRGSVILAYGVFFRHDNQTLGLKRMRLVDFQTLDGNIAVLAPMLSWALERCRREGIDMLESIGFRADKRSVISKIAPYERKLPSWLYFYKTTDKSLAERLSDPNAWDPSQFDGDASL
jgi:hypothetical protein